MELTQELVKEYFDYLDTGKLVWKKQFTNRVKLGQIAGALSLNKKTNEKRVTIGLLVKRWNASRFIFLWHKGYLPEIVDHEDQNPLNDRIENLRPATKSQNQQNGKKRANCSSKYIGVTWSKRANKWFAYIRVNKERKDVGYFETENEAALAYNNAIIENNCEFSNINIII